MRFTPSIFYPISFSDDENHSSLSEKDLDICNVGSCRIQMLTLISDNTHQVQDGNRFPY